MRELDIREMALVSGGTVPVMVGGKVAAVVTAELLHAMNFAFAAGVLSGAISNQDEAGTNYGR